MCHHKLGGDNMAHTNQDKATSAPKKMKQQLGQSSSNFMQEIGELAQQIEQQSGGNQQVQQAAYKIQQLTQQVLQNQQAQQ